ncbi:MAG TPA: TonB-dependent receptor [Gemmatimonadaceae bacterium]
MSRVRSIVLSLGLALLAPLAAAQQPAPPAGAQPSFEIRGKITDTAGAPLPRASVTLKLKGSPVTVAGAYAGNDGSFRVPGLRPATFTIRVVYIGYAPVIQDITLSPKSPVVDLGVAKLAPLSTTLSEVKVTEERSTMVTEPDRNAYTAKAIAPGASNASELLENVPSVQVDVDGKVSLRGNENVVIQVNGRPTPMRGAQLISYLKTLSANVIDRIEVVPNPSAKYDPEGMAGIINIALKQNVDLGLSSAMNSAYSTTDRYNVSGNVGYQSGPWTSFVSLGVISDERTALGTNDRQRYDANDALQSTSSQHILLTPAQKGQNLNLTVDYKPNKRDVLSNALMLNHRTSNEVSLTTQSLFDPSGSLLDQYLRPRDADSKGTMVDYDVAFKRSFKPREHELSTELRFNRSHNQDVTDERHVASAGMPYDYGKIDRNDAVTKQLTGQLDYTKTLRPRVKLDAGWKSNARWLDRDYVQTEDATGDGTWTRTPLSNALTLDEGVHAVYALFSEGVKKWDFQAGLRGEYATRNFVLGSDRYPYDYASLFPSAVASYNFSEGANAKASYSRRINRPGMDQLNPFPTYFDADNVFFGNPNLSPEYTDAIELGVTKTGKLGMVQLQPFWRHTTNVIRIDINTTDTLDNREITSISFRNLAKSNSWGSDLTGQLRLGPKFSALTNLSLFKMVTDGGSASVVGSSAIGWMGRVNVTSEVTKATTLQGAYNYRGAMKIERGEMGAQQMLTLALRQKVQGDRGAVTVRVNDPFEMLRFHVTAGDAKVVQITERNPESRMVFIGYSYTYGRPPRVRQVAPEATGGGSVGFGGP